MPAGYEKSIFNTSAANELAVPVAKTFNSYYSNMKVFLPVVSDQDTCATIPHSFSNVPDCKNKVLLLHAGACK